MALTPVDQIHNAGLDPEYVAIRDALHGWLQEYNRDRQPYPGQCTGTHMIGMGDCQFAARAVWARMHPVTD